MAIPFVSKCSRGYCASTNSGRSFYYFDFVHLHHVKGNFKCGGVRSSVRRQEAIACAHQDRSRDDIWPRMTT